MLLHIGRFHLDLDSRKASIWHSLAPRTRILSTFLLVFAIALTPNGHWLTWAIYALAIFSLILLVQISIKILLKRVTTELGFIALILLGTLFHEGDEVLWQWGWLKITTVGLTIVASVTIKTLLSLLMLNLLTLTTSIPDLLVGLVELKIPPLLVAILASMYRYIEVLREEFNSMYRAAIARNLLQRKRWQRLIIGNMIGSLFIRTYDRAERIHQAMLARGYLGIPRVKEVSKAGKIDIFALTLTAIITLLGQLVNFI